MSLDELAANPSLPMALRDIPLLDHRERRTGVSPHPTPQHPTAPQGAPGHCPRVTVPLQCTVTFCCSYNPHGAAGDVAVTAHGQVAPEPPHRSGPAPADGKEDFQVWHPRAR